MKLNYITISVRNIEESLKFYQEVVGLELMRRFNPGIGKIAFLSNGKDDTMLELIQMENMDKVEVKGMVLSFQTNDSLDNLRNKVIQLGYEATEIIYHPTKPTHFRMNDPDHIIIEFSNA